jgi:hypothetical protein
MSSLWQDIRVEAKRKLIKEFALSVFAERVFFASLPASFLAAQ